MQVTLDCEPRFEYARLHGEWEYSGAGYHEPCVQSRGCEVELRLSTDMNIGFEGPRATGRTLMKEGDTLFVSLAWSEHPAPTNYEEAYDRLVWTAHHWQHWLDHGQFPDHPWRTHLQRAALTLKGLSYAPTGALVAAATTSLPETPGGERNWDYRYTWIRDATFMLWGLYTLGFDWEANDFFYFIADVAESEQDQLQIMYGIGGEDDLPEHTLDHLSGYEDSRPVRIGNGAYNQEQHDVWGALLDSVYLHTKSRDHLPERIWPILKRQVEMALEKWREPDRGIWEVRGEPRHFTSSKLMCWVAADRGARLAEIRGELEFAARWQSAAEEIKNDILENALDERGVFTQHYETDALDASVLLMVMTRFLPPDDERIRATVLAIATSCPRTAWCSAIAASETDDGLSGEEGTFTICSFWLVSALVEIGEVGPGARPVRQAARLRQPARAVRRGDRPPLRTPPRQLPAGLHPPGADQRRHARDPRRPGARGRARCRWSRELARQRSVGLAALAGCPRRDRLSAVGRLGSGTAQPSPGRRPLQPRVDHHRGEQRREVGQRVQVEAQRGAAVGAAQ